jgi:hypothetical protein
MGKGETSIRRRESNAVELDRQQQLSIAGSTSRTKKKIHGKIPQMGAAMMGGRDHGTKPWRARGQRRRGRGSSAARWRSGDEHAETTTSAATVVAASAAAPEQHPPHPSPPTSFSFVVDGSSLTIVKSTAA